MYNFKTIKAMSIRIKNVLNFLIEGFTNRDIEMSFEFRLADSHEFPLAIYSPGHFEGGIIKHLKGNFTIENQVILPENMNCGSFVASIFLTYPNKEFFMIAPKCIHIISEGVVNRGMIFEYNREGLLIL